MESSGWGNGVWMVNQTNNGCGLWGVSYVLVVVCGVGGCDW